MNSLTRQKFVSYPLIVVNETQAFIVFPYTMLISYITEVTLGALPKAVRYDYDLVYIYAYVYDC